MATFRQLIYLTWCVNNLKLIHTNLMQKLCVDCLIQYLFLFGNPIGLEVKIDM